MPGPGEDDPGGTGDPHIRRLDGATFDFGGVPGALHRLYEAPGLRVLPRILAVPGDPEGRTYFAGVDVEVDGPARFVVLQDGRAYVIAGGYLWAIELKCCTLDAPGHLGCTSEDPHPLQGVPHLNITLPAMPADRPGEAGLMVDGDADSDPAAYAVDG